MGLKEPLLKFNSGSLLAQKTQQEAFVGHTLIHVTVQWSHNKVLLEQGCIFDHVQSHISNVLNQTIILELGNYQNIRFNIRSFSLRS